MRSAKTALPFRRAAGNHTGSVSAPCPAAGYEHPRSYRSVAAQKMHSHLPSPPSGRGWSASQRLLRQPARLLLPENRNRSRLSPDPARGHRSEQSASGTAYPVAWKQGGLSASFRESGNFAEGGLRPASPGSSESLPGSAADHLHSLDMNTNGGILSPSPAGAGESAGSQVFGLDKHRFSEVFPPPGTAKIVTESSAPFVWTVPRPGSGIPPQGLSAQNKNAKHLTLLYQLYNIRHELSRLSHQKKQTSLQNHQITPCLSHGRHNFFMFLLNPFPTDKNCSRFLYDLPHLSASRIISLSRSITVRAGAPAFLRKNRTA